VVELDEYESFLSEDGARREGEPVRRKRMFHVGRSILHLKKGVVVEEPGTGWGSGSRKS